MIRPRSERRRTRWIEGESCSGRKPVDQTARFEFDRDSDVLQGSDTFASISDQRLISPSASVIIVDLAEKPRIGLCCGGLRNPRRTARHSLHILDSTRLDWGL